MLRCYAILVLAGIPLLAVGAPIPKEDDAERIRRTYGVVTDRDRDCKFELAGEKLRLTIPGKQHFLERKLANAPRVGRVVEGDFTITARVAFPIRPAKGLEPHQRDNAIATGGVIAWSDDNGEMVWIMRAEFTTDGEQRQGFLSNRVHPGVNELHQIYGLSLELAESTFVRINRSGNKVVPSFSPDGKTWYRTIEVDVSWGKRVKVGMTAENGYKSPFVATFDQYLLDQPK